VVNFRWLAMPAVLIMSLPLQAAESGAAVHASVSAAVSQVAPSADVALKGESSVKKPVSRLAHPHVRARKKKPPATRRLSASATSRSAATKRSNLPALPEVDADAPQRWSVASNAELRDVLYGWSQRAGWSLVWDSEYSYQVQAGAVFSGDFVTAVTELFAAMGQQNPPLYPQLYQGNRVLVINAQPNS
jgi:hypothetical protein